MSQDPRMWEVAGTSAITGPGPCMLWGGKAVEEKEGEDRAAMDWLCFWHSLLHLRPENTQNAHKGEKEGTVNCPPPTLARQRKVRNQEMSLSNRTLWARQGVEARNSAVSGEHARGYAI